LNPLATYLRDLRDIRSSGTNVPETSFYSPLANLLNEVGWTLKPRVRFIINPKNQGAGIPNGGFFTADQLPRTGEPDLYAQLPARGVMEVKGTSDDAWQIARSAQVAKYLDTYGQVLVTNYRDFVLLGRDANGKRVELQDGILAQRPGQRLGVHYRWLLSHQEVAQLSRARVVRPSIDYAGSTRGDPHSTSHCSDCVAPAEPGRQLPSGQTVGATHIGKANALMAQRRWERIPPRARDFRGS
jgi:hypothetical protein